MVVRAIESYNKLTFFLDHFGHPYLRTQAFDNPWINYTGLVSIELRTFQKLHWKNLFENLLEQLVILPGYDIPNFRLSKMHEVNRGHVIVLDMPTKHGSVPAYIKIRLCDSTQSSFSQTVVKCRV